MFSGTCRARRADSNLMDKSAAWEAMKPSGNAAFDAYKSDTLRRLQDAQASFDAFLDRLRAAKDKAEFDEFMEERAEEAKASRADKEDM